MKKLFVLFILLAASVSFAQDKNFSIDASAMGFNGAGQTSSATIIGGAVSVTKRLAIGYEQILVPELNANYYLGTLNYTIPLNALLGQKISGSLVFDASKFNVRIIGGAGVNRQELNAPLNQRVATTLGGALEYSANKTLAVEIFSAQWIHAGVHGFDRDKLIITPNTSAIASGLKLRF
jgi:hypothetical protein